MWGLSPNADQDVLSLPCSSPIARLFSYLRHRNAQLISELSVLKARFSAHVIHARSAIFKNQVS